MRYTQVVMDFSNVSLPFYSYEGTVSRELRKAGRNCVLFDKFNIMPSYQTLLQRLEKLLCVKT
jgi:hypothetical protein